MWKCPCCGTEHRQLQDMTQEERARVVAELSKEKLLKLQPNRARGGEARARNLTPERRREIAIKAAWARWAKKA